MAYRIIVADKDPGSREILSEILGSEKFQLVGSRTASELKLAIKAARPSLVIVDSRFEDVEGEHAVQKIVEGIRKSRNYSDLPVVIMARNLERPLETQMRSAGVNGFLKKPIDGPIAREELESVLGIHTPNLEGDNDEDITIDFEDYDGDLTSLLLGSSASPMERSKGATPVKGDDRVPDTVSGPEQAKGGLEGYEELPSDISDITIEALETLGDAEVPTLNDEGHKPVFLESPDLPNVTDQGPPEFELDLESVQEFEDVTPDFGKVEGAELESFADTSADLESGGVTGSEWVETPVPSQQGAVDPVYDEKIGEKTIPDLEERLEKIVSDLLPSKGEICSMLEERMLSWLPSKEEVLKTIRSSVAEKLENVVSAGQFPTPDVNRLMLETVEKVLREQIEKITADLST